MSSLLSAISGWLRAAREDNADAVEQVPQAWAAWGVFLASALGLYFELVMIRWHAASAHVFAIFKNVSLLSCFLGLGVGFALARQKRAIGLAGFLPLLGIQLAFFALVSVTIGGAKINPVAEQLVMGLRSQSWSWSHAVFGNFFLAAIFVVNALMFIPVGYATGRLMTRLAPLHAYSLNLLGSLAGIGLFFLLSWLWTPPLVWMACVILLACPLIALSPRSSGFVVGSLAVGFLTMAAVNRTGHNTYYSPYQVITLALPRATADQAIPVVRVNHSFYQDVLDLRPENVARSAYLKTAADYYNLPYRVRAKPGSVLVVGAGTGNDVAAALRGGASAVTGVEIDPAILHLGRAIHAERPYQDQRTRAVACDARTYIRQTDEKFDTIVYGLLDSHTNLGSMTNVRLDSFVYTLEAFKEAVSRLTGDGLLSVSYLAMDGSQADKLFAMLSLAYPESTPKVFASIKGYTFFAGPGLARCAFEGLGGDVRDVTAEFAARPATADIATDDWPYFYMQQRAYPLSYAVMILLLLGLSVWMVRSHVGDLKLTRPRNAAFFFLGAGFMLVETKVITELGLTFGNTWAVIGIAITGVLLMAYLANLWVARMGPVHLALGFTLLLASLGAGLLLARTGAVLPLTVVTTPTVLVLPLFFAGLIFSSLLAGSDGLGDALAANLFGGMLGGFLEYNSMYWGLTSLYPLGMALYALAMVCSLLAARGKEQPASTSDEEPQPRLAA
jgi:hypothetical protein